MRTLRTLVALAAMTSLTFALSCGPGGGDNDPEVCNDGVDNDGDGLADCFDPDCAQVFPCDPCDEDGVCDAGETNANCPSDCLLVTCDNDGVCDAGETITNCPDDCQVVTCDNDGTCDTGETTANCPDDCPAAGTCETVADLTEQDGCDTGEKCTVVSETALGCATAGAVADYAECGTGGTDDCQAGAICAGPTGGTSTCMPFCDQTHPCTGGACAGSIPTPAGAATLCMAFDDCEPFDASGCPNGEGCYILTQAGDTICGTAGTVAVGGSCQYVNDCGVGVACLGDPGVCTELCLADGDCTTGTCLGIGEIPGHPTLGACGTAP